METSISTETLEVRADYQTSATSDGCADGDGKAKREEGRDDLASLRFYLQGSRCRVSNTVECSSKPSPG